MLALGVGKLPFWWFWSEVIVIHTLALVALACYVLIRFGDPGEIKRSLHNCFPMPQEMLDWLEKKARGPPSPPPLKQNPKPAPDLTSSERHSYCVRCYVWRPVGSHHCRTCQRCVVGFDHHCGVFGRCIAAKNIVPFYILLYVFYAGFMSGVVFSVAGIMYRVDHVS